MSSDETGNDQASSSSCNATRSTTTVELMLFDSLVHHLIEKGILTKNDALSIVGTVAAVKQGQLEEHDSISTQDELGMLHRLFESLKAINVPSPRSDGHNVHRLRPPLHGDKVEFPRDD